MIKVIHQYFSFCVDKFNDQITQIIKKEGFNVSNTSKNIIILLGSNNDEDEVMREIKNSNHCVILSTKNNIKEEIKNLVHHVEGSITNTEKYEEVVKLLISLISKESLADIISKAKIEQLLTETMLENTINLKNSLVGATYEEDSIILKYGTVVPLDHLIDLITDVPVAITYPSLNINEVDKLKADTVMDLEMKQWSINNNNVYIMHDYRYEFYKMFCR